jgi:ribosomal protein S18 acetylase RimI-like enzyme
MAVTLRPASHAELAAHLVYARDVYVAERIRAGDEPAAAAWNADESYRRAFPDGRPAGQNVVFRVERDGQPVGMLWIGPREPGTPDRWWVWDIVIDEAFRGQGIGRETMLLAESEARARGAVELGLNVFGHNHVAAGLYRSLGYEVTAMQMSKPL